MTNYLYLIFNIIDREAKELLLYSIFIILRYCHGINLVVINKLNY